MYRGSVAGPQQAQGGVHRRVMRDTRRPTDLRHPSADRGMSGWQFYMAEGARDLLWSGLD